MMNKITRILVASLLISPLAMSVDLGDLDPSFSNDGSTDGWDIHGNPVNGFDYFGGDVLVDSQQRVLVVGTYEFELASGIEEKAARLLRYLPTGQIDTSFGANGIVTLILPPALDDLLSYEMALDSSDGVFVGYSRLFCPTQDDADCHSDVRVYHVNSNGNLVGSQTIAFDAGGGFDRNDDVFADLVYVPSLNKVAITAEVERTFSIDTDFGIAVLNADPVSGQLSIDTSFSSDGKSLCFFDHQNASGSKDSAEAIAWDPVASTFIVAGSVFEGNGTNFDGWNMAFCEFNLQGDLVRKWSTQSNVFALDSREFLSDMVIGLDENNEIALTVSGSLPGDGDLDIAVARYYRNIFGDWEMSTSFGDNASGYGTVGFAYIFAGDTRDLAEEMLIQADGSILIAGTIIDAINSQTFTSAVGLAMFTKEGRLDTTWGLGNTGKAVHTFNINSYWDTAGGVAVDPQNQEIYIVGTSYNGNFNFVTANFHNDRIFANGFD